MTAKIDMFTPVVHAAAKIGPRLAQSGRNEDEESVLSAVLREVARYCEKEIDGLAIDRRGALGQSLRATMLRWPRVLAFIPGWRFTDCSFWPRPNCKPSTCLRLLLGRGSLRFVPPNPTRALTSLRCQPCSMKMTAG